jgi:hypothetical protein
LPFAAPLTRPRSPSSALLQKCRELNNFNSLFAIYCGLSANPIHRMRRTKEVCLCALP